MVSGRRNAPRGGLSRERLEPLVAAGLSQRAIAARLGVSQATVRHWLKRHGLQTRRSRAIVLRAVAAGPDGTFVGTCERHGRTDFSRRSDGYLRCSRCRSEQVAERRTVKRILVEEAGGSCVLCGYDRCVAALQFHHLDRSTKAFHLGHGGMARSIEAARAEARKCVLLCANCHAEVEAGFATLPTVLGR